VSVQAVWSRDMSVIQASVITLAVWVILCSFIADIIIAYLDPRIST